MAYFKIGDTDYSMYANGLKVNKSHKYNSQTNAAGDTVVDYVNAKRTIEVGIIPLDSATMIALQADIDKFDVSISFRNPITGALEEDVKCIIPSNGVDYYTIQQDKVMFKTFTIKFIEL